jgi:hypothetical protein
MEELIETSVGLPNTCTVCGGWINEDTWFARNVDAARSGMGGHKKCMEPVAIPKRQPKAKVEIVEES